ncbi:MAG: cellulase family glycosylhydrolase [Reichenbachiella sp.]
MNSNRRHFDLTPETIYAPVEKWDYLLCIVQDYEKLNLSKVYGCDGGIDMKGLIGLLVLAIFGCNNKMDSSTKKEVLQVQGRFLMSPCNEKIILKGVNEMFIWSNDKTGDKILPEIAKTGANSVRLVWNTKGTAKDLDNLISNCIALNMIPIPELHDATGKIELVPDLIDYWVSDSVQKVIKKHESYLILNIANEAGDHSVKDDLFLNTYKNAITRIRATGYQVPLMIDAAGWGKNTDILQSTWKELMAHDLNRNLLFSVHTWWPKTETSNDPGSTKKVVQEIQESVEMGMPLVVAEFAPMGPGCKQYFDYKTLIKECYDNEIGWLSWSWGHVKNGDCSYMDMTNDGVYGNWQHTPENENWGEIAAVTHKYSIKNTAVKSNYILNGAMCQ